MPTPEPESSGQPSPASEPSAPAGDAAPDPIEALLDRGYRYALALTHDPSRADDLVQDAALAILSRDAPRSVGYLFTTIRNRFIDQYRRSQRVKMQELPSDDTPPTLMLLDEPDEEVDPEKLLEALGTLRPVEREVMFLAYVEDYTAEEIANLMVSPRGTILSLMHRARKKMLALLSEETS